MLAGLITGTRRVELVEFPDPTPPPGGVVVDVAYCGICGTDVSAYRSGRPYRPAICGHEWTGTVSASDAAAGPAEGDRVVVGVPAPCGTCGSCRAGHPEHCMATVDVVHGRDRDAPPHGGFASRLAVAASRVIAVGDDLDDVTLAMVEPVTVSVHAVDRSGMRPDDLVVVVGAGPVGLLTMQCARAMGSGEVVVVEPDPGRGALAGALGAAAVTTPEAAPDVVAGRRGGLGADVVFDCAGGADALASAVALSRRGGTVCLVGLDAGPVPIEPSEWLRREITVRAVVGYVRRDFDRSLDLLAQGLVRVDPLHTSTTGLDDLAGTFASLAAGDPAQLKVLVDPR